MKPPSHLGDMIRATPSGTLFTREGLLELLDPFAAAPEPVNEVAVDARPSVAGQDSANQIAALRYYDVDEVCVLLSPGKPLSTASVYKLIQRGQIASIRVGPMRRMIRVQGSAMLDYLERAARR